MLEHCQERLWLPTFLEVNKLFLLFYAVDCRDICAFLYSRLRKRNRTKQCNTLLLWPGVFRQGRDANVCDCCSRKGGTPMSWAIWQSARMLGRSFSEWFVLRSPASYTTRNAFYRQAVTGWRFNPAAWPPLSSSPGQCPFFPNAFRLYVTEKQQRSHESVSRAWALPEEMPKGENQWGCLTHVLTQRYPMEFTVSSTGLWERIQRHLPC